MTGAMASGPPIVDYEKVVTPISIASRSPSLNKRDKRSSYNDRRHKEHHKKKSSTFDDTPHEPMLGNLFDYSA